MATFSLDDIRAAAEAKYGSTDITMGESGTVRLLNPLRLPKAKRDKLSGLQDSMKEDGADQEAIFSSVVRLVADNTKAADALLREVGGDLAVLASIFEAYSEGSQVGEASPSAE